LYQNSELFVKPKGASSASGCNILFGITQVIMGEFSLDAVHYTDRNYKIQ
jgi:hypothetical protein